MSLDGPDTGQLSLTKSTDTVAEGTPVTLTCATQTAVNPDVQFRWAYADNTVISTGIGSKQGSARNTWSQTLTLTPDRAANRQVVRCRVTNTQTSKLAEGTINLNVNCK